MPRVSKAEIERIKQDVSLLDWVRGQGYEIKKQGKDYSLSCPFHDDDTPSMIISPNKNLYHCFGCEAAGSVIDWVMHTQSVSFPHAMELLRGGSPSSLAVSHNHKDKTKVARSQVKHLEPLCPSDADAQTVLQEIVGHYHQNLLNKTEALAYLEKRGLMHPDLVKTFKLGLSNKTLSYRLPPHYQQGGKAIRETLKAVGVLRKTGFEHFAGCLVIPTIDERGQVMELYGRRIAADNKVEKGNRHLYLPGQHRGVWNIQGLIDARALADSNSQSAELILCESHLDALTFWVHGYQNVTTSYGANGFTDDHLAALKTYGIEKLLIAYDNDTSGNKAATALAERLQTELPQVACYRVVFPADQDVNSYALKVQPAQKALDRLLRNAEPMTESAALSAQSNAIDSEAASSSLAVPAVQSLAADATKTPADAIPCEVSEHEVKLQVGHRSYRIRGLDKNTSYGQLKINLLVSLESGKLHVDTLDLYHASQRDRFIKQASSELGIGIERLKQDIGQVLLKCEALQDEQIQQAAEIKKPEIQITDADKTAALELLKSPDLINRIIADFQHLGLVGEDSNALVGYLAAVSRKLDKPLAVIIQSSSAAGKSSLMEAILSLVPNEERVQYSALTGQSLFYMGETNLKHKILAISEEEGAANASYALKLLQSEGEVTIASTGKDDNTGQLVTKEYRVEGPVMLLLTTTAIDIDEELLNRCLVLSVNESREQTQAIHQLQRQRQTLEGLLLEADKSHLTELHQNAQRLLRPLLVANPFAEQLRFLDTQTRTRRDHMKYLTLIRSIALIQQYQREVKRVERHGQVLEYIEVAPSDIELANKLAHEVLGRTLDELPPQTRKLLKHIHAWVNQQCKTTETLQSDFRFSRRDIRDVTGWGNTQIRIHLDRLVDMEYLLVHRGSRGQQFVYELVYQQTDDSGETFLSGLIDVENLKSGGNLAGQAEPLAGSKRPQNGVLAGSSRDAENGANPDSAKTNGHESPNLPETQLLGQIQNRPNMPSLSSQNQAATA